MTEAFVYCWTDHKTNKLYIGSHKGTEDDGYICSSKHMMEEYNNRPNDFTRQIIAHGNTEDIRKLEAVILQSVDARLNEDFYNLHQNDGFYFDGWTSETMTEEHRKNMSISASKRKRTKEHLNALHNGRRNSKNSPEHNEIIRQYSLGRKASDETREKQRQAKLNDPNNTKRCSKAGKASAIAYRNDSERQRSHSERMKKWWADRKRKEGLVNGD